MPIAVQFEIIDENSNVHGPFATIGEITACVESRALGEQRDDDGDDRAGGWTVRAVA
jgi:hypothetical protein